jgi:hypothetical protein
MEKNKSKYDNLIFYALCDALYREKCKSNYGTFSIMVKNIKNSLQTGSMSSEQFKIVGNALERLETLYGLTYGESTDYLLRFIDKEIWRTYIKPVTKLNNLFKNYP